MDIRDSARSRVVNTFERMWQDSLPSSSPNQTYTEAWNMEKVTDDGRIQGLTFQQSNELFVNLPGVVRGLLYVEDRDYYIVFVDNESGGEIGIIHEKDHTYEKVVDSEIYPDLHIGKDQWVDCTAKIDKNCRDLYLYFSTGDVYRRINIDDPCEIYEETELIKPVSLGALEVDVVKDSGHLPNGIYSFAARAVDKEGNSSNWSRITPPVSISGLSNKPAEISRDAININVPGINNPDYHIVELAVVKTIGGVTSVNRIAKISTHNSLNSVDYLYIGDTGEEVPIGISEILNRTNKWVRGKNLMQYDNKLVLYNLRPVPNLDYQKTANNIETEFVSYIVPLEYADQFKFLRKNENYWFGIRWNYVDGTTSVPFAIPGRGGCQENCEEYSNNAKITTTYFPEIFSRGVTKNSKIEEKTSVPFNVNSGDESNVIEEDNIEDPTITNESDEFLESMNLDPSNPGEVLDCLCASLDDLKRSVGINNWLNKLFPSWLRSSSFRADLSGLITVSQLECFCENRKNNPYAPEEEKDCGVDTRSSIEEDNHNHNPDCYDEIDEMKTGESCDSPGEIVCIDGICYKCEGGEWTYQNNTTHYKTTETYTTRVTGGDDLKDLDLSFEEVYDEDGCTVVSVKPKVLNRGKFGTWCTQEFYPETEDCDCNPIYGDLAGERIRLHKVPSSAMIPDFISFSEGVPNRHDMGNSEFRDAYVIGIGLSVSNIEFPENPPKPLNPDNPYSIMYVKRTEGNKTVVGSAVAHSCFKGSIGGEEYAFPKHAVNSFEFFDRHINPSGETTYRGGESITDAAPYFLQSADFNLRRPMLSATTCLIEGEVYGKGFRHGTMAEGEEPESNRLDKLNQKGTRQAVNLNRFIGYTNPIKVPIKALSVARADSVVQRGDGFTYPLSNLKRESGVYMELDGTLQPFIQGDAARNMTGKYGGVQGVQGDNASDRSFTGDIFTESVPIHDARAHYMTLIRFNPSQYGGAINQTYIPIGLEGKTDSVEGPVGDSYVGAYTYKRTGLVSDKTNRVISRVASLNGFGVGRGFVRRIIGNLLKFIFRSLNIRNGGYIPESQDAQDYIRVFGGLRYIGDRLGRIENRGEVSQGDIPDPIINGHTTRTVSRGVDINHGDNYFPQNLKTLVTTFTTSDANLNYRIIGEVENGEVYYSNDRKTLRNLHIDSSMPEESEWDKGFLNRWYSIWKENARWKVIYQAILLFLFKYGVGLIIIFYGIREMFRSLSNTLIGGIIPIPNIGAILALALAVLIVLLGVAWIRFWISTDIADKFIANLARMKNLRPDRKNPDNSYSFNESRLRQFENNYWDYDVTHSLTNEWEAAFGMGDPYDVCDCSTTYTNEIMYSPKQDMDSPIDFWRVFKPNDKFQIPNIHGTVSKIFEYFGKVYAHTTDALFQISVMGDSTTSNSQALTLGTGTFFGAAQALFAGVVEGYGGLKDGNAAHVTSLGYFFPDRDARKWYRMMPDTAPREIVIPGLERNMDKNMKFHLLESFPEFKFVDLKLPGGIGYSIGINHSKKIAYFTKIDYKPIKEGIVLNEEKTGFNIPFDNKEYWQNKSFTVSLDISSSKGGFISFHNMVPFLYAWNRRDMYSFKGPSMWLHDKEGDFLSFYGETFPALVEFNVNDLKTQDSFYYESTIVNSETFEWRDYDYRAVRDFFTKGLFYNSHQMTGTRDFIDDDSLDFLDYNRMQHYFKTNLKGKLTKFNSVHNYVPEDVDDLLIGPRADIGPREPREELLSSHMQNNRWYDNFLVNRFIFDRFVNNRKIVLKTVVTQIDNKNQQ